MRAEAQIMNAVLGVLNESLTESLKGFYNVRKAFQSLEVIAEAETRYLKAHGHACVPSHPATTSETTLPTIAPDGTTFAAQDGARAAITSTADDDEEDEFFDVDEATATQLAQSRKNDEEAAKAIARLSLTSNAPQPSQHISNDNNVRTSSADSVAPGPDVSVFTNPIDVFIHSGTCLNFGILLLLISIIPPAFSKILYIIGFKGDRERGLSMLWQAARFDNLNGAMAGLVLLAYYNGLFSTIDIAPVSGPGSFPRARCDALLSQMRARYPRSRLWLLEESRVLSAKRQPDRAIELIVGAGASPLKQVEALQWFELSLNRMFTHQYQAAADSFQHCMTLNDWSRSLYLYLAGVAHVELYRLHKYGGAHGPGGGAATTIPSPDAAAEVAKHAAEAERLLTQVPEHAGKKRFMAKQLPFETFVLRKVSKWQARAQQRGVALVDAVGVSPVEEMIYFWAGYRRLRPSHLADSLAALAWSDGGLDPHWRGEDVDERSILALLRATVLRTLGRTGEAKALLHREIVDAHAWEEYKGGLRDNWPAPLARYELAVNHWQEQDKPGVDRMEALRQCGVWIEKVAAWDSYDLDARFGIKITTARATLKALGVDMSGAVA